MIYTVLKFHRFINAFRMETMIPFAFAVEFQLSRRLSTFSDWKKERKPHLYVVWNKCFYHATKYIVGTVL